MFRWFHARVGVRALPLSSMLTMLTALVSGGAVSAQEHPPLDAMACVHPTAETPPGGTGCWILAERTVELDGSDSLYWHLQVFPSRQTAEAAATPSSVVVEAEGRVWLYTVALKEGMPGGGELVASVGPLHVPSAGPRIIAAAFAVMPPGSRSRVHSHSGPEAWYLLQGEQCLETPGGVRHARAGESMSVAPGTPMQLVVTGESERRSLVVVVHEADRPFGEPSEWRPAGRCELQ